MTKIYCFRDFFAFLLRFVELIRIIVIVDHGLSGVSRLNGMDPFVPRLLFKEIAFHYFVINLLNIFAIGTRKKMNAGELGCNGISLFCKYVTMNK